MSVHETASRGFGQAAAAYDRARPDYPREATDWLSGQLGLGPGRMVVDVGAGTGKLTRALLPAGIRLAAVEPVAAMRAVLERALSGVRALDGTAEALPLSSGAADGIVAGQAFHWFAGAAALAEFHRALRSGGRLGLIWNRRRVEQPLQKAISEIIEPYRGNVPAQRSGDWRKALDGSRLFAAAGELTVPFEQRLDADGLVDRVGSTSFIAALSDRERSELLGRVRAMADAHSQPLVLGYSAEVFVYDRLDGSAA